MPRDPNRATTLQMVYGDGTYDTRTILQGSGTTSFAISHPFPGAVEYTQHATIVETGAFAESTTTRKIYPVTCDSELNVADRLYTLTAALQCAASDAGIEITANNVVLDLNGHKISGVAYPTEARGRGGAVQTMEGYGRPSEEGIEGGVAEYDEPQAGPVNQDDGVRLGPGVDNNRVENNTVERNGLDGIAVFFGPTGNTTSGNVVKGNRVKANGNHLHTHRKGDGIRVFGPHRHQQRRWQQHHLQHRVRQRSQRHPRRRWP